MASSEQQTDVFGIIALVSGILAVLCWGCCAIGSVVGLSIFALAGVFVFGLLATIFGFIGAQQTKAQTGSPSALAIAGAVLGVLNLLGLGAYCCFTIGVVGIVMALYASLFGAIILSGA